MPPRGATWGSRDVIVFSSGTPAAIVQVSSRGGAVSSIVTGDARDYRWPVFLPDGSHFIYWGRGESESVRGLNLASIDPEFKPKRLVASDSNGAFAAPDALLFTKANTLFHQHFDPTRLEVTGDRDAGRGQVPFSIPASVRPISRSRRPAC